MPKFLDAPQWYGSDGYLTNAANLSVGIVQVRYQNASETIEVRAYFPLYIPQSKLSAYSNPLVYYSIEALLTQQDLYSLCTGHLKTATSTRADISYMIFSKSGDVIFKASDPTLGPGGALGELSVRFSVSGATNDYTATYLQGGVGYAYLE